jgi:hypothetical protein
MKPLAFLLMTSIAVAAWAQDKPAPKEAAKPEARKEEPKKQAAAATRKQRRWSEDARHCLERPTNTEVIKCAEEYL